MTKSSNTENLRKYLAHLENIGEKNLVLPRTNPDDLNGLMNELAAEGFKLLEEEELQKKPIQTIPPISKTPCDRRKLTDTLAASSPNPYIRARNKVLTDLPEDRRKRIEEMERIGNTDNPSYDEFAKMVTVLGDKFSA